MDEAIGEKPVPVIAVPDIICIELELVEDLGIIYSYDGKYASYQDKDNSDVNGQLVIG